MLLFWEKGYEGVTLNDLQTAMGGITPPSFYAAFGSKEQLFKEVVALYGRTVGARPAEALEGGETAAAAIEAMLREASRAFCGSDTPRGCLIALGAINCTHASKAVADHLLTLRLQVPGLIRKRLERGVAAGDIPPRADLDAIAAFYATVLHGLAIRAHDGASREALLAAVDGAMAAWPGLMRNAQGN